MDLDRNNILLSNCLYFEYMCDVLIELGLKIQVFKIIDLRFWDIEIYIIFGV